MSLTGTAKSSFYSNHIQLYAVFWLFSRPSKLLHNLRTASADLEIPHNLFFINILIVLLFAKPAAIFFASIIKRLLDTAWAGLIYAIFIFILYHRNLLFP